MKNTGNQFITTKPTEIFMIFTVVYLSLFAVGILAFRGLPPLGLFLAGLGSLSALTIMKLAFAGAGSISAAAFSKDLKSPYTYVKFLVGIGFAIACAPVIYANIPTKYGFTLESVYYLSSLVGALVVEGILMFVTGIKEYSDDAGRLVGRNSVGFLRKKLKGGKDGGGS